MRKIIIGFVALCLVAIVILLFSFLNKNNSDKKAPALNTVPLNAAVLLHSRSYTDFMETVTMNSEMWRELIGIKSIAEVNDNVFALDSLTHTLLDEGDVLLDNELYVAIINTGKTQFDYLFSLSLENAKETELAKDFIQNINQDSVEVIQRQYNNETIHTIGCRDNSGGKQFHYCFADNIFIGSFTALLVENAIRQYHSNTSLQEDPFFEQVKNTAGENVDCNIYVNYETFPELLSCLLRDETASSVLGNAKAGKWGEWDADIKNRGVLLNGFSVYNKESDDYFSVFKNQKPVKLEVTEILPANTSAFVSLGASDLSQFKVDYAQFLLNSESGAEKLSEISELNTLFGTNVTDVFVDILDKEMVVAYTDINTISVFDNCYALFQVKSKKIAEDAIVSILNSYCNKKNIALASITSKVRIDRETEFEAYKMPVDKLPKRLFGKLFEHASANYVSFMDNYMVFAGSLRSMEKFAHSHVLGTDLDHDSSFGDFIDRLSKSYNIFAYGHVEKGYFLYKEFLASGYKKDFDANGHILSKYQAFACQYASSQNMLYSNVYLYFNPEEDEKPRTVWESRLDSAMQFKPKLVETHVSKGKEIFIQDLGNTVYMINKAGRILWKQPIKEPINSQIFHVDFYKNGKIQYAFSTKNYFYVIDRIGNFVENFPMRLKSPSTAGMTVLDYGSKKNYRFIVPCEDHRVYLYNKEGNVIDGWQFGKTDTDVASPIEHFDVDGKDYILFADKYMAYVLNRRGEQRLKLSQQFEKCENSAFLFEANNGYTDDRFVTTTTEGQVVSIFLDGTVAFKTVGTFTREHCFEFFDINGDGKKDYVFLDKNVLFVFKHSGEKLYDFEFNKEMTQRPVVYRFGRTDVKIGVVDTEDHLIYLINNDGTLYEGFPLRGNTLFSIGVFSGGQGKFNLLVGSEDNFLYNYRVN